MLKLKFQYFGYMMWRTDALEKTLMLGKIEGREKGDDRRWDGWMASPAQWTWVWASSGSWWWTGKPGVLQSMGSQRVRHYWVIKLNWCKVLDYLLHIWTLQHYEVAIIAPLLQVKKVEAQRETKKFDLFYLIPNSMCFLLPHNAFDLLIKLTSWGH